MRLADAPSDPVDGVTDATYEVASNGTITDVDAHIADLRHTYLSDIKIELIHNGVTAVLFAPAVDWGADDIVDATFDSDSATPVRDSGAGPLTGRMRPQEAAGLDKFDGSPAGGTWTLRITDHEPNDSGTLNEWSVDGPRAGFPCTRVEIPEATTGAPSSITTTSAAVAGAVDPNGRTTGLRFAYGTTTGYGAATAVQNLGAADDALSRSDQLTGLEPGTTYHYRVEAIREGGAVAVAGADRTFTTGAAPIAEPTPPPGASPTPAPDAVDRSAPAFTAKPTVKLTKAGKRNKRATFSFSLSEPAAVSAVVTRAAPGIRKGARCVAAPKRKPRGSKSCTRQLNAARGVAKAGATTLALPPKGLGKGVYTATLTAVDAAGNGSTATVRFTVR